MKNNLAAPMEFDLPVDSPPLPVNDGIVSTPKQFSDGLTLDLTDDEIQRALRVILPIKTKWQNRFRAKLRHQNFTVEDAMRLTDQFEDELVYELATQMDLIATVDVTPVFEGQAAIIEIVGALPSHYTAKYGFDHERKEHEVKKAVDLKQDFLGSDKLE